MMAPLQVRELSGGVWQLQSRLWATNSVLVAAPDGGCVVCDPSIFDDEVAEIRSRAGSATQTHVLITHSDWDHTCGIPAFAGAAVATGPRTARAISDGSAADKLREATDEWGLDEPGTLHVDRVLETGGETMVGAETVLVIDAPGHAEDGSAFLLAGRGLLVTGDYLSPLSYPLLSASLAEAIETYQRLLAVVDGGRVRLVVPGHGPAMKPREALRIGLEDLAYARGVRDAALRAVRDGASTGEIVLAAHAVAPPRLDRIGLEAFGPRSVNAHRAARECQAAGAGA